MIINLTKGFEPFGGSEIEFEELTFPSGVEHNIKFKEGSAKGVPFKRVWFPNASVDTLLTVRIQSMDDVMRLFLATDALRRVERGIGIGVFFPYVPYARQDRIMVKGEPLSIKVFADLINSQNYDWVGFYDVHSDVTPALINNSYNYTNKGLWESVLNDAWRQSNSTNKVLEYYVCSPDAGASKKIGKLVESVRPLPIDIIQCNKTRDLSTGKIIGLTISHSDLGGKDVYIVDDICSKGGTFMMIAKKLRELNAGKIYLVVSHWEDSADKDLLFNSGIEKIYTTDSMQEHAFAYSTKTQIELKQYKLEDIL